MASLGKSIDLYLMDGTATGRWQATLSNWNCNAYKIPRADLKKCDDLLELHSPGVYFLFGRDNETSQPFIYVGEGDDVLKRILQPHTFEKDGSYWTEVVILITLDGSLDKAKIKYLENRFHHIVVDTNRYIVKNGNTPPQSPVQKKIQDMLEEFILNTQLIMPALGHKVFEPQPSETDGDSTESNLFIFRDKGKSILATGKVADDGFWVLKGSYISPKTTPSTPTGVKKARQEYAKQLDQEGKLVQDVSFGSPSYAASFVIGRNSNGLTEWKNKDGLTLKELNEGTVAPKAAGSGQKSKKSASKPSATTEPVCKHADLLYLASKKVTASAYISNNQIVVTKGSQISPTERQTCRPWVQNMRKELLENGKVVDNVFTVDTPFSSPSAAAAAILGGESNGQTLWRNKDGKTLKELSMK